MTPGPHKKCPRCAAPILDHEARYCARCGVLIVPSVACPACGTRSPAEARFCPSCGKSLSSEVAGPPSAAGPVPTPAPGTGTKRGAIAPAAELEPVAGLPTPGKGLSIEFYGQGAGRSTELVELAKSHPSFLEGRGPEGPLYRITLQTTEILTLLRMYDLLEAWVGRRAFLDGRKVDWTEFFLFLRCYRGRLASIDQNNYCFWDESNNLNLWGCFRTGMGFTDTFAGSEWLSLGRFEPDNSFVFDKKKIIDLLEQRLAPYRLCPALDLKFVNAMLRVFPDRMNPNQNRDWTYLESAPGEKGHGSSTFRKEAAGDRKVEVVVRGIRPASPEAATKIFGELKKRALALLQRPPG